MASTATVTAPTGPGVTNTATVIADVLELYTYAAPKNILFIKTALRTYEFDINATTTYTVSIAAGVVTVTISQ